jgi:DNA-3-methyladenine glycosylase
LGKILVCRRSGCLVGGWIVEVEAYVGENDPACHAAVGRTERNAVMYGPPGHAYVYFTYGMHHCFNVVAGRNGEPEAVLVRALEPAFGLARMRRHRGSGIRELDLARGPARLCQALGLDRRANGKSLVSRGLFIARGRPGPRILGVSARVGIRTGLDKPWRFYDAESPFVSSGRPGPPGKSGHLGLRGAPRRHPPSAKLRTGS